jgi:anthranilate phosphoribosyltransferase
MWVQWTSIGAIMLKKHSFEFLIIYCLIKSLKALLNIKEQLNKKTPYLILFPFWKSIP